MQIFKAVVHLILLLFPLLVDLDHNVKALCVYYADSFPTATFKNNPIYCHVYSITV